MARKAKKTGTPINRGMKAPSKRKHRSGSSGSSYASARKLQLSIERAADPGHKPLSVLKKRLAKLTKLIKDREAA